MKTKIFQDIIDRFNQQMIDGSILNADKGQYLESLLYAFGFYHHKIMENITNQMDKKYLQTQYDIICTVIKLLFVQEVKNNGKN